MAPPLALTDEEKDAVLRAAVPIVPAERGQFLIALAAELERHPVVGEGLVHRLAADLQRSFVVQARRDAETRLGEASPRARQPRQGGHQAATDRPAGP